MKGDLCRYVAENESNKHTIATEADKDDADKNDDDFQKADGIKNVINTSKNPSTDKPRQVADGNVFVNGLKVKSISGLDSSKLRIKTKNLTSVSSSSSTPLGRISEGRRNQDININVNNNISIFFL